MFQYMTNNILYNRKIIDNETHIKNVSMLFKGSGTVKSKTDELNILS